MALILGTLALLLLIGAPVAIAVLMAGVLYLGSPTVAVAPTMAPLRMTTSLNNFLLIAVPLFIFAGELLAASGVTQRLVTFAEYLVGWLKAGLAQVNVVMSMFFGGISGLSMADAAAVGTVMIPSMKRSGYPGPFAAGVTGVSSVIGPVLPPSVPAIIYAVIAGTSVAGLFAAGIIPGFLLGLVLMFAARLWATPARAEHIERVRFTWSGFGRAALGALPGLLAPAIILVGIFSGVFTATEASAIAAVYVLALSLFNRTFSWKMLHQCCMRTVQLTGVVLFIFAAAAVMAWAAGMARIPEQLVGLISSGGAGPLAVLFGLALFLLVLGTLLDPLAAMIIAVPVVAPLGASLGVDPLQLGVLVILTLSLGMVTPPVGYVLYIVAHIGEESIESVIRATLPFLLAAFAVVIAVILVPPLTTWAPGVLAP